MIAKTKPTSAKKAAKKPAPKRPAAKAAPAKKPAVKKPAGAEKKSAPKVAKPEKAPITQEMIADRAYHLWLEAGRPEGQETTFWLRAEAELRLENARP